METRFDYEKLIDDTLANIKTISISDDDKNEFSSLL
jgi:hypothetical protein